MNEAIAMVKNRLETLDKRLMSLRAYRKSARDEFDKAELDGEIGGTCTEQAFLMNLLSVMEKANGP